MDAMRLRFRRLYHGLPRQRREGPQGEGSRRRLWDAGTSASSGQGHVHAAGSGGTAVRTPRSSAACGCTAAACLLRRTRPTPSRRPAAAGASLCSAA
jgi:hypothetical protein